jgi:polysaccharide export outer membrane protein
MTISERSLWAPSYLRTRLGPLTSTIAIVLSLQTCPLQAAPAQPSGIVAAVGEPSAGSDAVLELGPGDRVTVTVFGQPDLTGDHTLDSQGFIELPIGLRIAAANTTVGQLEGNVTAALADGYIIHPRVSVRVAEWRPVYVLGDVHTPGAVAYRYGMTILTAIALAGDSAFGTDSLAARGDLVETEGRLQVMQDQRAALRARIARLTAQRDSESVLNFPPNLQTNNPAATQLLTGERAVFEGERAEEERQVELITQQVADANLEVRTIAEHLRLAHQQLDSLSSYLVDLDKLARSGLVERRRVVDLEQEKSRVQANIARLGTEAVRAGNIIQEAPLRMTEIRAAARQRAQVGLQDANAKLAELNTSIEAARELVGVRGKRVGSYNAVEPAGKARFWVIRPGPDGLQTFQAQETAAILPGDILRVSGGNQTQASVAAGDQPTTIEFRRP